MWYEKKPQADRRINSSTLHRFKKCISSICDTRKSLRRTAESNRRRSIASRNVSLQYVIREKASGGQKNQVVDALSLQEMYPFNMRYEKKPQADGRIKSSTLHNFKKCISSIRDTRKSLRRTEESLKSASNCLRQMSVFTVESKKPQANWRITLEKSICLRQFFISNEKHRFA